MCAAWVRWRLLGASVTLALMPQQAVGEVEKLRLVSQEECIALAQSIDAGAILSPEQLQKYNLCANYVSPDGDFYDTPVFPSIEAYKPPEGRWWLLERRI